MTKGNIKKYTSQVTVTADAYSDGVFSFSGGTKEITVEEICRGIAEFRKRVIDAKKDWEVICVCPDDDTEIITRYNASSDSYHVILP